MERTERGQRDIVPSDAGGAGWLEHAVEASSDERAASGMGLEALGGQRSRSAERGGTGLGRRRAVVRMFTDGWRTDRRYVMGGARRVQCMTYLPLALMVDSTGGFFFLSPSLAVMRNQLSARYPAHCADQLSNYDSFSQVRSLHARITPLRGTTRHAHSRLKFPL